MSISIRYFPAILSLDSIKPQKKILFKKTLINNFYHKVSILTSSTLKLENVSDG